MRGRRQRWSDGLMACRSLEEMCNVNVRCALPVQKMLGSAVDSRPTVYIKSVFTNIAETHPFKIQVSFGGDCAILSCHVFPDMMM